MSWFEHHCYGEPLIPTWVYLVHLFEHINILIKNLQTNNSSLLSDNLNICVPSVEADTAQGVNSLFRAVQHSLCINPGSLSWAETVHLSGEVFGKLGQGKTSES